MTDKSKWKKIQKSRSRDYTAIFNTDSGQRALADLKRFCYATQPTACPENPYVTYLREGRREVWLRIAYYMKLTDEDIEAIEENYNV